MVARLTLILALGLLPGASSAEPQSFGDSDQPDASITSSEEIEGHEGSYQDIHRNEGHTEDIHRHEARAGEVQAHEEGAESLSRHDVGSEALPEQDAGSEALVGMGHPASTAEERLQEAREKLRAARERHAPLEARAQQALAESDPDAPAASSSAEESYAHWTARIDVARQRIGVARAAVQVWDDRYANMIQSDYPRGAARQQLIDDRERAKQRLASEEANLPRLIEAARRAGVPQGVLALHSGDE